MESLETILKNIDDCVSSMKFNPEGALYCELYKSIDDDLNEQLKVLCKKTGIDLPILRRMLEGCRKKNTESLIACLKNKISIYTQEHKLKLDRDITLKRKSSLRC
ncbi:MULTISPECIES: hypothetical protein [Vibrio harveyi group]|uniref:hypothetical protein n=1 Tax=Vibrio harveyi group TaxID=717610 RepID=UPI00111F0501|nr:MULTISPECIES: hypothetical protein [Vibrio harveyi group]ELA7622617.1 hypothetical protein [Vibrio parahaemolyticus]ELY2117414.1 hypothetical protein [Vibrio parahaemolyticus]MCG6322396.1 hypothetical protein [Vibrio alginolyticus]TOI07429.1 hypothetical protein CGI68_20500 [Vibrio parahaemolyticus]WMN70381.1 hypothetical protein NI387_22955 [Vibrio parahaemolyticus]